MGHVEHRSRRKFQNSGESIQPKLAVADGLILLRVAGVQADGDRVHQAVHLLGHIPARDKVGQAVGIDADKVRALLFDLPAQPHHVIPPAGGFAVAAEHHLVIAVQVPALQVLPHFLLSGFAPLIPEVVRVQAAGAVLPQAEVTGIAALVCHIDIQVPAVLVGHRSAVLVLFHVITSFPGRSPVRYPRLNSRRVFSAVTSSTAWASIPRSSPIISATKAMREESFRLPR